MQGITGRENTKAGDRGESKIGCPRRRRLNLFKGGIVLRDTPLTYEEVKGQKGGSSFAYHPNAGGALASKQSYPMKHNRTRTTHKNQKERKTEDQGRAQVRGVFRRDYKRWRNIAGGAAFMRVSRYYNGHWKGFPCNGESGKGCRSSSQKEERPKKAGHWFREG